MEKGTSRHKPVLSDECTKCHSPHKAKLDKLLLAKSPDLCLTCHKDLKTRLEKEKAHQPAARNCERCHKPHFSEERALINQKIQPLCGECHDYKKPSFAKSHLGIDPQVMDCRVCHEPHASKDPKFFKAYMHAPFAGRACEECHIVLDVEKK
jgi:predicted CXXCH cytochrome family protein